LSDPCVGASAGADPGGALLPIAASLLSGGRLTVAGAPLDCTSTDPMSGACACDTVISVNSASVDKPADRIKRRDETYLDCMGNNLSRSTVIANEPRRQPRLRFATVIYQATRARG
jgi:hypothetical protein